MEQKEYQIIRSQLISDQLPSGSILARVLSNLPAEDVEKLRVKAAEGAMGLELEKMRMIQRFHASSAEIRDFIENIKAVENAMRGSFSSSYRMEGEFETASGKTTITTKKGCYIATVVYGSPAHPNVIVLKKFKSDFLEKFILGKILSKFYNVIGPIAARSRLCKGTRASIARFVLDKICNLIRRYC
ncbi:MAG TPA: CFI-box-CTERM domain-containing protein [bacterium]|jgi:hypothetical protein